MQRARPVRRTLLLTIAGVVVVSAVAVLRAQAPATATPPAFEVASVKPNVSGNAAMSLRSPGRGRLTVTNFSAGPGHSLAYRLQGFQLV
jgi:hypothetical protein